MNTCVTFDDNLTVVNCCITKFPNKTLKYTIKVSLANTFKGLFSFKIYLISINRKIKYITDTVNAVKKIEFDNLNVLKIHNAFKIIISIRCYFVSMILHCFTYVFMILLLQGV